MSNPIGRHLRSRRRERAADGLSPSTGKRKKPGLRCGMVLTDACAILPSLKTLPANPAEEAKDLEKLAAWCQRYTPWTAPRLPDGLALDVTGAESSPWRR